MGIVSRENEKRKKLKKGSKNSEIVVFTKIKLSLFQISALMP